MTYDVIVTSAFNRIALYLYLTSAFLLDLLSSKSPRKPLDMASIHQDQYPASTRHEFNNPQYDCMEQNNDDLTIVIEERRNNPRNPCTLQQKLKALRYLSIAICITSSLILTSVILYLRMIQRSTSFIVILLFCSLIVSAIWFSLCHVHIVFIYRWILKQQVRIFKKWTWVSESHRYHSAIFSFFIRFFHHIDWSLAKPRNKAEN